MRFSMPKLYYQMKAVQITVYVAKPRKKYPAIHRRSCGRLLPAQRNSGGGGGGGYDRKAQLLLYSRQMRALASGRQKPPPTTTRSATPLYIKETIVRQISPRPKNPNPPKPKEALHQIVAAHSPPPKVNEPRHVNPSSWKVVPVEHKPSAQAKMHRILPACLGSWKKVLFPSFLVRSLGRTQKKDRKSKMKKKKKTGSITNKMNAILMNSRMCR